MAHNMQGPPQADYSNSGTPNPELKGAGGSGRHVLLIVSAIVLALLLVAGAGYLVLLHQAFCSEGSCNSRPLVATTTTWVWDGLKWSSEGSVSGVGGDKANGAEHLAFDASRGQLVLVAHSLSMDAGSYSQTWIWDGGGWRTTPASTSHDFSGTLVYDTKERQLFMFSDRARYRWSGSNWQSIGDATGPGNILVAPSPIIYDPLLSKVLGVDRNCTTKSPTSLTNTFVFSGTSWTSLAGAALPSFGDIAFDSKRNEIVLFGDSGCSPTTQYSPCPAQTWTFDGTTWMHRNATTWPTVDKEHQGCWNADWSMNRMTFDPATQRVVLLGVDALWTWDGNDWSSVKDSGLPPDLDSNRAILAFDDALGKLVVVSTNVH